MSFFANVTLGGTVNTESFNFGDGTATQIIQLTVTSVNATDDIFYGEATITHTYAATGTYTAFYASSARLTALQNNSGLAYRSQATVQIDANHNSSPVSTVPPIVNIPDGQAVTTFSIPASDPDGQSFTYRFATPTEMGVATITQPTILGISINSATGLVTCNTTAASVSVNQLYNTAFVVTDALGATTMVDFILKIVQPSTPPAFNYALTPANNTIYNIQPGQTVTFQVSATDIDSADYATLSGVGLPSGSTVSPSLPASGSVGNPTATVTFSWTPTTAQLGSRIVSFVAQDVNGNQTTTSVTIVTSMNPLFDAPPTLAAGSFNCLESGNQFTTTIQAHTPNPSGTVQITSATTLPGVTYTPAIPTTAGSTTSTVLSWTPTAAQWGPHTFSFTATDDLGHTVTHSYDLTANTTPVITSTAPSATIYQNQPFSYTITVADPDLAYGDNMDISGIGLPAWLTLTQTSSTTAVLSGTPTAAYLGNNAVQIDVEDSFHHCHNPVSQTFNLNVQSCTASFASQTPTVNVNATNGSCAAASVAYSAAATGPVTPTYTYTFTGATSGSGSGTGSGSAFNTGTTTVDVSATASCGTVHDIFSVVVTDTQAPIFTFLPSSVTVNSQDPTTTAALGTATATDNCGSPTVTFADVSTKNASSSNPGFYNYTITRTWTATDIHSLTTTGIQVITVQDVTAPSTTPPPTVTQCNNLSGNNLSRTVSATDLSGSPLAYTYAITGATSGSGNGVTASSGFNVGTSVIVWTVTDVSGNAATATDTVKIYGLPAVSFTVTNVSCNGFCNGIVTANASAGTSPYSYTWTGSSNVTATRNSLCPGTYPITVMDAHNCQINGSAAITEPAVLNAGTVSATSAVASCLSYNIYLGYASQSSTLGVAPQGGTGPYSYTWTPSTGVSNVHVASPAISPIVTSTYTVAIADAHGCSASASYQIKVLDIHCGPKYVGRELNNSVYMCENSSILCISPSAVPAHLSAGACLGNCGSFKGATVPYIVGTGAIKVYPNPARNNINVLLNDMGGNWKAYQIVDLTGRIIAEQHLVEGITQDVLTIDVSKMVPGLYLIRVSGNEVIATSRFSVE